MSLEIKSTPVVYDDEAIRFLKIIDKNKFKKIPKNIVKKELLLFFTILKKSNMSL